MCEICLSTISNWEQPDKMSCRHSFCKTCWESYLTTKIQDGDAHHILCPAYQCHILVPVELIEKLVSPDMARRYLQFDIKAFVESNKSIKWCPIAGCGRAVRLPEAEQTGNRINNKSAPITSHAVDCGNAHFFCWECLGEAHAPCGCKQWQEWQIKIAEIKPEELKASCSGSEDAANCLWLVTNSKPCPNCKSPIQKNEGCNHMKCSKCKFDFCWVCQESWKRHSSATGGYFRCNRFEAVHKADEKQGSLISEAMDRNNQMQEMSRFLHFYTRFRNHENSQKLEEPLLTSVRQKMEVLASSLGLKGGEGKMSACSTTKLSL
jgi:ankyrin repeat/IBR domain-containing protein 1